MAPVVEVDVPAKFAPEVFLDAERSSAEALALARKHWSQLRALAQHTAKIRHELRTQGDFANADALREAIEAAGFYIEDRKLQGQPLPPVIYRK